MLRSYACLDVSYSEDGNTQASNRFITEHEVNEVAVANAKDSVIHINANKHFSNFWER